MDRAGGSRCLASLVGHSGCCPREAVHLLDCDRRTIMAPDDLQRAAGPHPEQHLAAGQHVREVVASEHDQRRETGSSAGLPGGGRPDHGDHGEVGALRGPSHGPALTPGGGRGFTSRRRRIQLRGWLAGALA